MSDPSSTTRDRTPVGRATAQPVRQDPAWVRPTLIFLFGVLVGTLVIAGSRPMSAPGLSSTTSTTTAGNIDCDQAVSDAQHVVDLANRTAAAAQHADATSLSALTTELKKAEGALDLDLPACHS